MSAPYEGDSTTAAPGIKGTNTSPNGVGVSGAAPGPDGVGVSGTGANGVEGASVAGNAVLGLATQGGTGVSGGSDTGYGVWGSSTTSVAVRGDTYGPAQRSAQHLSLRSGPGPIPIIVANPPPPKNTAIYGNNWGLGADTAGVLGENNAVGGYGVLGWSDKGHGVRGLNDITAGLSGSQPDRGTAVSGDTANGYGVWGASRNWEGVRGIGLGGGAGVAGFNEAPPANAQPGVWGESKNGEGVHGVSHTPSAAAIAGFGAPGGLAGYFAGNVTVTGDVFLSGADCAEQFDIAHADRVEPGTVMALADDGRLEESQIAYDRRVAGVISGAGSYKPGIVLDRQEQQLDRKPIALAGKAYCKADAQYGAIETGDLLTTSPTPGHAMKAADQVKAFGAVIGKALRPLKGGRGLIPILIALQ
jgi:hypothetical protein